MGLWLLNEPFLACMDKVERMQVDKGIALADIVRELHIFIVNVSRAALWGGSEDWISSIRA